MSDDVRVERIELELEWFTAAQAQLVAASLPGALAVQMALWPQQPRPPSVGRADRDAPDVDAIAAGIFQQLLDLIAVQRERNDEDASWH
ncbi:MAG: hypothetical protein ABI699_01740 [Caldimonas sp.]